MTTQKLRTQNSITKIWQNSKAQIVTQLKNSKCSKTQKIEIGQISKTQKVTKLKNSKCDKTQPKSKCDQTQNSKCDKTQNLKMWRKKTLNKKNGTKPKSSKRDKNFKKKVTKLKNWICAETYKFKI